MFSPLLAKAAPTGRETIDVTPKRAGWAHVDFCALRRAPGECEICLVVPTGSVDATIDGDADLNAMAGPNHFRVFKNDPAREWMLAPGATLSHADSCSMDSIFSLRPHFINP